jgi:hypothetical protein
MHVARGISVGLGDIGGERLDQGDREIAGSCRGLGQTGEIERACLAGLRDRARYVCGDDTGRRLGAPSSQTARMAALDSMGASNGERPVLMMHAT